MTHTALAWGIQAFGIGSAALFFISGLPLCLALLLNSALASGPEVSLLTYYIGQFIPLTMGARMAFEVLNVFVPLVSPSILQCIWVALTADSIDGSYGHASPGRAHHCHYRRRLGFIRRAAVDPIHSPLQPCCPRAVDRLRLDDYRPLHRGVLCTESLRHHAPEASLCHPHGKREPVLTSQNLCRGSADRLLDHESGAAPAYCRGRQRARL